MVYCSIIVPQLKFWALAIYGECPSQSFLKGHSPWLAMLGTGKFPKDISLWSSQSFLKGFGKTFVHKSFPNFPSLLLLLFLLLFFHSFSFADSPDIEIIYPRKGQIVHAAQKTFILGRIIPADAVFSALLSINGDKVDIYRTGGFLAVLPVTGGDFSFHCEVQFPDGTFISKSLPVRIPMPYLQKTTELPIFERNSFFPVRNMGILLGEETVFQCKTLPGKIVECTVGNFRFSLVEQPTTSSVRGFYRARYSFPTKMKNAPITFSASKESGIKPFTLPVTLSVFPENEYSVAEITENCAKARWNPDGNYDTFLKKGTFVQTTGFQGSWLRLALSKNHPVFVHKDQVKLHPTSQKLSGARIKKISVTEDERFFQILLSPMNPVNLTWVEHPDEKKLEARFYRVMQNSILKNTESNHFTWYPIESDVFQLNIFPNFDPEWGYDISFENNRAKIRIKKPLTGSPPSKIKICLDPGHGPDSGAIGPTGKTEESCTLSQMFVLREALEKRGFSVFLTREKREGPPLEARPKMAIEKEADLFVSLHYNASGDGTDPYQVRGFESYYYNRAGKKLGQKIHARVAAVTPIKNKELRFGNFAVCRNEWVPAVLLEIDYLIIPEAEEAVQDKNFRHKIAEAICDGIEDYLNESQFKQ